MKYPRTRSVFFSCHRNKFVAYVVISATMLWLTLKLPRENFTVHYSIHGRQDCQPDPRPLVVMGIYSDNEYRERRDTLRNTWIGTMKKMDRHLPFKIIYKFFLDKNTTLTDEENEIYKDIMYLHVPEQGYAKKFGRKMFVLLNYIYQVHPEAYLGIRIDDDVFLCVPQIFQRLDELKSPNLYYGWRHGKRDVMEPSVWIDEMFLVLGKNIMKWVSNQTYCGSFICEEEALQDTDYGDTSLRNWITEYKDIDFHSDNERIKHIRINADSKNWTNYVTLDYCETNVVFHNVKISAFMNIMHKNNELLKAKKSKVGSVSGKAFSGEVKRSTSIIKVISNQTVARPIRNAHKCSFWAVVTTIFNPSNAVRYIANSNNWCLVVVADIKTPPEEKFMYLFGPKVIYLSVEEQIRLYPLLAESIPFSSFSRKNIGYMYAIHSKAKLIWDFDDDNIGIISKQGIANLKDYLSTCEENKKNPLFNPYPYFRQTHIRLWPRGFPLDSLKDIDVLPSICSKTTNANLAVIQSLANGQPDVDAIYRMTYDFPFNFTARPDIDKLFLIPQYKYTPFNAQATLWFPRAYKYLALPISVNGRVSDIWRSYIAEHFFHKANLAVAFSPPYVFHNRTEHNIMADFNVETPLYEQSGTLVKLLSSKEYPDIVNLYDDLYKRFYIEEEDLHFIRVWIRTFEIITKSKT